MRTVSLREVSCLMFTPKTGEEVIVFRWVDTKETKQVGFLAKGSKVYQVTRAEFLFLEKMFVRHEVMRFPWWFCNFWETL